MNIDNQADLLPIVIEGQTFKPNEDGMWNLNEIAKALNVREPGQWRNAVQAALIKDANLHVSHGNGTLATEEGAIAYAMWVSTDFYLMVIRAFIAMRNSAVRELRHKDALLDANMPKATTLDLKALGAGLTWTEACRVAGIQHPALALKYLHACKRFVRAVDSFGTPDGPVRPPKKAFDLGHFVPVSSDFGSREGWRVKPGGLDWLVCNTETINTGVADGNRRKAQAKKAAQASRVDRWGRVTKEAI
ncbi:MULTISPECIES: KilA-N domain-containing protein [Pseudomonas]|uniref:KilA-N domain-containing protein n=1 Tax=Pseudomonas TaxID=286 RepID=UPI00272C0649|nr:KilA-N domain-containing protein [Pseudomonas sp. OVF7]WLD68711.1 KilA-N domain-containing protein [Pseudomonas sp. OVF7]